MSAKKLLEKLNEQTGLDFILPENQLEKEETEVQLASLLENCKGGAETGIHTKEDYLRQYLLGELSDKSAEEVAAYIHMDEDTTYALFLVMFQTTYDELSASVLSSLEMGNDTIVGMDDTHIVLIRRLSNLISKEEMSVQASYILDALGSEAMQAVLVSYDRPIMGVENLPAAYLHSCLAMQLGSIFKNGGRIHSYQELSMEKLLYRVPEEDAREYLSENFGTADIPALDNEMRSTIKALFKNQLSLADTAKDLYIHRNTLVYRMDKIQKLTGLDLRKFDDAVCLKVAIILSEYLKK